MKRLLFIAVLSVFILVLLSCTPDIYDTGYEARMDGIRYKTLEEAVAAFNVKPCGTVEHPRRYTIEVYNCTCNVAVNTMIIKQMPGRTLTVKSVNPNNMAVIKPDYDSSENVKNNSTNALFCISGLSVFTGGSVALKNLKFDMSEQKIVLNSQDGWRIFAVYALGGHSKTGGPDDLFPKEPGYTENIGVHRYAHNILIDSCEFVGPGGKYASAFGANQNGCNPSGITIKNCSGEKLNCWFNGYLNNETATAQEFNLPYELKIENCTTTDFLCIMNSQSVSADGVYPRVILNKCNGSFFAQVDKDGSEKKGGTENGIIYSNGGSFSLNSCNISSYKGKSDKNAVYMAKGGISVVTISGCKFPNKQETPTDSTCDAWNNGGTLLINGKSVSNSSFYNLPDK